MAAISRFVAGRAQRARRIGGAAVLPDDGVVDRLAGRAVPDHGGLALVGDADAGDIARPRRRPWPAPRARSRPRRPDLLRVVLDPAGRRINLRNSCCALATGASAASNTIARVEVVPWSMARRAVRQRCPRRSRRAQRETGARQLEFNMIRLGDCLIVVGLDRGRHLARRRAVIVAAPAPAGGVWRAPRRSRPAAPWTRPA